MDRFGDCTSHIHATRAASASVQDLISTTRPALFQSTCVTQLHVVCCTLIRTISVLAQPAPFEVYQSPSEVNLGRARVSSTCTRTM